MSLVKIRNTMDKLRDLPTISLAGMLLCGACAKSNKAPNEDVVSTSSSTSTSQSEVPGTTLEPVPGASTNDDDPEEFLTGYVLYQHRGNSHLEQFQLKSNNGELHNQSEVRLKTKEIDSFVVKLQIPERLDGLVGGIQNPLLTYRKFAHSVTVSDIEFSDKGMESYVQFKVSGLQFAGLPKEAFTALKLTLATVHNRPLKNYTIYCTFDLRIPGQK